MIDTTMPKRAISVVLAAVLACTLMPSASLAYAVDGANPASAAEQDAQTQPTDNEAATDETAAQDGEAVDGEAAEAATEDVQRPQVVSESHEITQPVAAAEADNGAAAQQGAPTTQDNTGVEIVSANVVLGQQTGMLLSYNGLTYEVDPADANKANLVGISDNSIEGALEIPAQVSDGATTYIVSGVKNCGGGCDFFAIR